MTSISSGDAAPTVRIVCGDLVGELNVAKMLVTVEGVEGEMSPADFERIAGRGLSKKWKSTIKVYDPEHQESTLALAEWALLRGIKLAKCSASSGALPRLNGGGLGQASLHNSAQLDLPRPPSQLDLGLLDDFLFDGDLSDPDEIMFGGAFGKRAAAEPPAPQPAAKRAASGQPSPCSTLPGPTAQAQAQQEVPVFDYTISPRGDGIAHMKRFGAVHMGRVLRWVVLLGGCQEVTRCRGWALVASRLGLPLEADLHIQHIYISELLHMEKQQQQRLRQVHQQHVVQHRALLHAGGPFGTELLLSQPLLLPEPSEGLLTPSQPSPGSADDDLLQACGMFSGGGMLGQPADAFLLPLGQASGPVAAPPRAPVLALAPAAAPALQTGPPTELLQPSFLAVLPGGYSPPGSPFGAARLELCRPLVEEPGCTLQAWPEAFLRIVQCKEAR